MHGQLGGLMFFASFAFALTAALAPSPLVMLQRETPKVIYFDFGGVMVQPDRQVQLDYLVEKLGFPRKEVENSPYLCWMQLHPEEVGFLTEKAKDNHISLTPEALEAYRIVKKNSVREIPGMSELVSVLRNMHYEVNLITNIRPENLDLIEPLRGKFDHIVHCPKDPGERQETWENERNQHGLKGSQFLLIDDQKPNIDEAEQLGIQAIQFQNVTALIEELAQRHVLSR